MKRYRARQGRRGEVAELNVTAFMNLMVILVPFLLVLAVFSRVTIHELNLPGAAGAKIDPPALQLEIVLRAEQLILQDRIRGRLQVIDKLEDGYDIASLGQWLERIKAEAPEVDRVTILLEPQVDYQSLIAVMDTARGSGIAQDSGRARPELFPHITIGQAAAADGDGA